MINAYKALDIMYEKINYGGNITQNDYNHAIIELINVVREQRKEIKELKAMVGEISK